MLKQLFLLFLRHQRWGLTLFLWLTFSSVAQAAIELRVAVQSKVSQIQLGSSTTAIVKDNNGKSLGELTGMNAFTAKTSGSGVALDQWQTKAFSIEPLDNGVVWIGDRWYRGKIAIVRQGGTLVAINKVNLEDYLYSVVGAEAIPTWHTEALKSQAVAARTYALYRRSQAQNGLYDLDATTTSQVYKGLNSETDTTHLAVDETEGKVLTYGGKPILAAFHASSGGHTENSEDIWSRPVPYLRGVEDYDQQSPVFQWVKAIPVNDMDRFIGGVGNIRSFVPAKLTPQGRILSMKIIGDRGSKTLTGDKLRDVFDLRSTLFQVLLDQGQFVIEGRGYGHGLGLSQWGASYLANQGVTFDRILAHYYQNAQLTTVDSR